MPIKHIVISGGGPSALNSFGVIKHLSNDNFININNIESYYGTSSGAILAVILILNLDFNIVDDYFKKRPWHKLFKDNINESNNQFDLIDYITNKGINGKQYLIKILTFINIFS